VGLGFSFVELEAKFNASSLLLNSRHFDIRRHSWKWCNKNSQNLETRALMKTPVAKLMVERYKKRHLAAQVRSTNGLRGIFKFSEFWVAPRKEREMTWFNVLLTVHRDISIQWEPTGLIIYFQFISIITASQHKCMTYTNCCIYRVVPPDDQQ